MGASCVRDKDSHQTEEQVWFGQEPVYIGKPISPESHHRATDVLPEYSVACWAKCPKTLWRTGLRKHLATQCLVLNLDGNEIDTMAGLICHSKTIRKKFHWLLSDVLQVAEVTKIQSAMDKGVIKNLGGKPLDEINDKVTLLWSLFNP